MNYNKSSILVVIWLLFLVGTACPSTPPTEPSDTGSSSINSLESITLGGVEQWILLQSNDISQPVLLVLHGGPGYAMMPLFHTYNSKLEEYFVVVNWDQRGAGKSYSPSIPAESMTLAQFMSDADELTEYLKERFHQEKIYLLGHSWGTVLGILLIKEHPVDYHGYVGVGQVVDVIENEQLMYDFALEKATSDGNEIAIEELERIGRPNDEFEYADDSGYEITIKWVEYYGGDLHGKKSSDEVTEVISTSEIYAADQEQLENGRAFSQVLFEDEAVRYLDFRTQVPEVGVPVYFFTGRYDYDTPFVLIEEYYDLLHAPHKEIIWFENSAHFPFYEEPERFTEKLINRLLAKSTVVEKTTWGRVKATSLQR